MELKVQDLRLRGRGFTLSPAAKEHGIDYALMDFLVSAIYTKLGLCSGDYDSEEAIKESNPQIPDAISTEDIKKIFSYKNYGIQDLLNNGLIVQEENKLALTKKSVAILERAAEIQKELDAQGFHSCPCSPCSLG